MEAPSITIDGFGPVPEATPASVQELQEVVRRAAAQAQALYPLGGRTTLGLGYPPTRPGIGVDMRRLDEVIDYPARDMTITVQAGITMARLQEILRAENQRLPIDVPNPEQATLGGAIATNASGARRYGFGTLRDYVIGISVINDEGQTTKAGGRVVKNVAGYDLCKLHIGALGTLGIIHQVTLKLRPIPEEQALICVGCQNIGELLEKIHVSRTRPVCLDLLNQAAAQLISQQTGALLPTEPFVLVIGFEDNKQTVAWQVEQVTKELAQPKSDIRTGPVSEPLWRALSEFPASRPDSLTLKANMLPSHAGSLCLGAASLGQSDLEPARFVLHAHIGNGIITGHVPPHLTLPHAQTMLNQWHEYVIRSQGNAVVLSCPFAWKKDLPIWGQPRGDLWLMKQVKQQLDPKRIFNPGRFVDGI